MFCVGAFCPAVFSQVNINPKNIQIVRDSFGVPHIYAKTDVEVAYGLAWATAEDDFKTMQWALLAAKGMQANYYGVEGAKIDFVGRLLRAQKVVQQQYDTALTPQFKNMLTAYSMAVNKYAQLHPKEVLVKKAFPVTEQDIMTGYVLTFCVMSGAGGVLEDVLTGKADQGLIQNGGIGSNAFAFNSAKTKDGNTYLAINSHQPLEGPLSWYEVHLQSEEGWNIIGGTFHGALSVLHGTNNFLGWAHTVNDFDLIDTYRLQMNPKKKNQYWFDGKWETLETEKVWLHVKIFKKLKLRLPVRKKTYWSKYGATLKGKKNVYAIRMAANQEIKAAQQWYYMNKAQNFSQFYKVLENNAMPRMTTVYADKYDTIFAISTGKIPQRKKGYNWQGILPGNTSETLWSSYHPIKDLPQLINPTCGVLFNVNNTAFDVTCPEENLNPLDYDTTMGYGNKPTNRSIRFHELLQQYPDKIDYQQFKAIKFDKQYPTLLAGVQGINLDWFFTMKPNLFPQVEKEIAHIHSWNRQATLENKELPLFLYSFWQLNKRKNTITPLQKNSEAAMHQVFAQCVIDAKQEMLTSFGTTNLTLGEVQRHSRGNVSLPCDGGPDIIKAAYGFDRDSKNRFRVAVGESYIQLVQFTKNGPIIESINAYGASNKPGSKHFTDQMQRYVDLNLKPMTFDKNIILQHAESIYSPQ